MKQIFKFIYELIAIVRLLIGIPLWFAALLMIGLYQAISGRDAEKDLQDIFYGIREDKVRRELQIRNLIER